MKASTFRPFASLLAILFLAAAFTAPAAPKKILFFTKSSGYEHEVISWKKGQPSFAEKVLLDLGRKNGWEFTFSKDGSKFSPEYLKQFDAVFFYTTGDLCSEGTDRQPPMTPAGKQALFDYVRAGKGFIGTHSATDTYQGSTWPWYVDFIGANFSNHSGAGTSGTAQFYKNMTHPILTAANTPNPWNRSEEWYTFTRDPLSSKIAGITILLTCHDTQMTQERDTAWVHEMPPPSEGARGGRLFYTAFGHSTSAFQEKAVMDLIIAGIKWAAYRL